MDKTVVLASDILLGVGGEKNILRLENCMTRVRVEVQDDGQLDIPRLRQLPGVSGYVKQGAQHQIIVGPGKAAKVVDAMRSLIADGGERAGANDIERTKSEAKAKYKAPMSDALRKLANVFIPLIPAFIASGLITGIINILKRPDIVGDFATHYPNMLGLMGIFGSAVFAIMNILVGVNTAKVFGGSLAMGGVMAGILSSPQLAQITLFGEALQPGRGGVIAVLLVVALMCWIERKFRELLPESLELILNPLLTTIITGVIAIVALQPLGGWISESIAHGASWAIDRGGFLVGAVLAGTFLPLVLTGLHQGLVPIHVELVQAHGYNALFPILAMAGVGQIGAAIAVLMKTRNARLKK